MHVTLLKAADAVMYRRLMLQAYELAADAFTSTAEERAAEPDAFWIKRVADPTGLEAAFGAFDDHDLVGTVALQFSEKPKTKHKAKIIGMFVDSKVRGLGIGRALVEAAITYAEAKESIRQLTLKVTEGNEPAISLYQSMGFQVFGLEPMAILTPDGYKAKVHMWRSLQRNIRPSLNESFG